MAEGNGCAAAASEMAGEKGRRSGAEQQRPKLEVVGAGAWKRNAELGAGEREKRRGAHLVGDEEGLVGGEEADAQAPLDGGVGRRDARGRRAASGEEDQGTSSVAKSRSWQARFPEE